MASIEGKELYNCSISSLVTNTFAVQWSQDDHISIITEKGIHIFELVPSPMTFGSSVKFCRSFVYPSDLLPTDIFTSQVNSVLWHWKREEIYAFLAEEVLMPRINVMSDLVPRIVSLVWSSPGMVHPGKCLLAMISSAGAVDVLLKNDNEWFSACEIHKFWSRIVQQDFPDDILSLSSEQIKYHIRRLQAVAIIWSDLKSSLYDPYSYLVVAYRSSDILIWKIPAVIDHTQEVIPTVALRINLNLSVKIDVMEWITISRNKCLIVMGLINGQILGLIVDDSQGIMSWKQTEIYSEKDLLKISNIKCILRSENEIRLIVSKSSILFVITIDSSGKILSNYYYRVPAFPITGVSIISDDEMVICTQNGKLFFVKIENQEVRGKIITTDLPKSHSQFLGLTHSHNKVLFATVTSPNSMYDHLVIREPSTLYIFNFSTPKFDPLAILKEKSSNSLCNYWDCIMAIGMKLSKSQLALESVNQIPINFENLPVDKLRVFMWLLVLADVYTRKKSLMDFSNISEELVEIRSLISLYSASSFLLLLAEKPKLTHEQRLAVRFLRTYLEIYIAGEDEDQETPAFRSADRALKFSVKIEQLGPELCTLCKTAIIDLPWKTEKCPLGHKLPRCAVTFLQITSVRYRSCSICKQIFHSCLDEDYPEGPKCLFCDIPTLHDSRVFGSVDRDRKNFSERRLKNMRLRSNDQEEGGEDDPDYF